MNVLLDTDIGNDIDDAVALAYLLRKPECELVGITTVTGQAWKRAALCEVVCRAAGREDIPIHCGRELPLLHGPGQPNPGQYETIVGLSHRKDWEPNTAVDFLRRTIRSRPGEITLLSIGPFANIALLFALDPEIPFLLKDFVSMAGYFDPNAPFAEWNCRCDPTATSMVYNSERPKHRSIGLDVTMQCQMSAEDVRDRFVGEPLATVACLAEHWFKDAHQITFHDPLAAATIFHPEICEYKTGQVTSPIEAEESKAGKTVLAEGDGGDEIALLVNSRAFFSEFFSVF
jgi:purine nucleosidase